MAALGLALLVVYGVGVFGTGYLVRRRRRQPTPFRLGRARGVPMVVEAVMAAALGLLVAGPAVGLFRTGGRISVLSGGASHALGVVLFLAGLAVVAAAQTAMGSSWRVGVDSTERTELVTKGLFSLVRNPIYFALVAMAAGEALIVGNVVALIAVPAIVAAVGLQVRLVEEPHLRAVHGNVYVDYCATTGRYIPPLRRRRRGDAQLLLR